MTALIICIYLIVGAGFIVFEEWRDPTPEGFYVKDIPMILCFLLFWPFFVVFVLWVEITKSKWVKKILNKRIW